MKKSLIIISILLASVGFAFFWEYLDDSMLKLTYPIKYEEYVQKYSKEFSVPEEIIYAVIKCESSFKSDALSGKGAIGLMQVTPATYSDVCSKIGGEDNSALLYDPETNIRSGTYVLSILYTKFGSWDTAYAAYNAGRAKVISWLADERYGENGRLKAIPYPETDAYVKKIKKATEIYTRLYFSDHTV